MKNAIITASTKGMGRATATAFAKEGINLAICARSSADLAAFKDELIAINPNIKVVTAATDVSKKEQLLDFAQTAERELGDISIIVNNAGIYQHPSILDDADGTLDQHVNTNLMPAYELYRYFGKKMAARKEGHIFTICSV